MQLWSTQSQSPVGLLTLVAHDAALVAVLWEGDAPSRVRLTGMRQTHDHPILQETCSQLSAYFRGVRRQFDLPQNPRGTLFQKEVWAALQTIGYGQTKSYSAIATQIGRPAASRAVGSANGKNPLSIIVPCHRVVGASGHLTGFAGGLDAKRYLLDHERSNEQKAFATSHAELTHRAYAGDATR